LYGFPIAKAGVAIIMAAHRLIAITVRVRVDFMVVRI
jgi:hypothetical protein